MHNYRLISKKGVGAFSEVLKAQDIKTGKYVAIKCMKSQFSSLDQVNNLKQIQALRRLSVHPNIIKLLKILYDQPTGRLALVFQLMDMNLYEWIRGRRHYIPQSKVRPLIFQLLQAIDSMHSKGIFHRDIKPQNILLSDQQLKLADLGSCKGLYSKHPYTEYISTRWYRPPQCLLTDGYYDHTMDIWGVGCVFFQVLALFPLFPGENQLDQVHKIHNILGTPPEEVLKDFQNKASHMEIDFPQKKGVGIDQQISHVSHTARDLIHKLLTYKSSERITARAALRHPFFRDVRSPERPFRGVSPKLQQNDSSETEKLPNIRFHRAVRYGQKKTTDQKKTFNSKFSVQPTRSFASSFAKPLSNSFY